MFESAVVLLLQPSEAQTLPLIGSLLAFRAIYYLLPLVCGVVVLAISELHRWRVVVAQITDRLRLDLGPQHRQACGNPIAPGRARPRCGSDPAHAQDRRRWWPTNSRGISRQLGRAIELVGGLALLLFARGLWRREAVALQWALGLVTVSVLGAVVAGAPVALDILLASLVLLLAAVRGSFDNRARPPGFWQSPAVALLVAVTLASSFWLITRG